MERARTMPVKGKGEAVKPKPVVEKPRPVRTRRCRAKDTPPPKPFTEPLTVNIDMSDALTLDWEEHLQSMMLPAALTDTDDVYMIPLGTDPDSRPGTSQSQNMKRSRTVDSSPLEAMTARRRRHWLLIVRNEVPKAHRRRQAARKERLTQCKRMALMCSQHVQTAAMQMEVEMAEPRRQRRKLNFVITQTELYAHYMQRQAVADCVSAERILHQLDEDEPRLTEIDPYDSASMKQQAARNVREAFRAERAKAKQFDAKTGVIPEENMDVDVEGEGETEPRRGDFDQPSMFTGVLKGYQLKGMNWLANLYDQGISGILADEMGLGKTVQCIAFLCHLAERLGVWGPFFVVSPTSTIHKWQQDMQRFAPTFKVVPYWGSSSERKLLRQNWSRKNLNKRPPTFHVLITSYQTVVADFKYLHRISWQYMILDEAQAIKSTQSIRWKLLLSFSCRNRLLLAGTPIQNSMLELWALLHFVMPALFDSYEEFNEWFPKDIERHAESKGIIDETHLSRLHMILKPFMLNRMKKDVENELSDKIEIMVHCPLTIRQKLLYTELKKKIEMDELLNFSAGAESGHSFDFSCTSNVRNLVMQFRKVCNHPELVEHRDVRSPFSMIVDDYHVPKLIADDGVLTRAFPSKRFLLYNMLSVLTPYYISESLKEGNEGPGPMSSDGLFAFTRLTNLSPVEIYRVALCGWLYAMQHIESTMDRYELIRHRINWWYETNEFNPNLESPMPSKYYDRVLIRDMLYICPDGDTLYHKKGDGVIWSGLLFTDTVWVQGGPFLTHADHTLYSVPEAVEHRTMQHKLNQADGNDGECLVMVEDESGEIVPVYSESPEFPHIKPPPTVLSMMPTPLPRFLYTAQPKVCAVTRAPFAVSNQHAENASGGELLARLVAACRPPCGWTSIQVPDMNKLLVSDAGKLTVLDSLLKGLKERGHRVLIYSQMTKMIHVLEEYMCYRKYKYIRLDGSSKICAWRGMVADLQARTDTFVYLLSTRAVGLDVNLTAADTVIFYDSHWHRKMDLQAMDRALRPGNTKQVTVYRLICEGTIEERIMLHAQRSEIQNIVISCGNITANTMKPKEVASLLLDDEEMERNFRKRLEEKIREEKDKKKSNLLPSVSIPSCSMSRKFNFKSSLFVIPPARPWGPNMPLLEGDDSEESDDSDNCTLMIDVSPPPRRVYTPPPLVTTRGACGSRRGPSRSARRNDGPTDNATAAASGAALLESHAPMETLDAPAVEHTRGRRGPGRPRPRTRDPASRSAPRRPRPPAKNPYPY